MDSEKKSALIPVLLDGRFTGRTEFAELIRQALCMCRTWGCVACALTAEAAKGAKPFFSMSWWLLFFCKLHAGLVLRLIYQGFSCLHDPAYNLRLG